MRSTRRAVIVILTLLAALVYQHAVVRGAPAHVAAPLQRVPMTIGPWQGVSGSLSPDIISALRPDDYLLRRYRRPAGDTRDIAVVAYVAHYLQPALNARIHSPAACLPAGDWVPVEAGQERIAIPGAADGLAVNRYLIQRGPQRELVLYWFQGRGRAVASEVRATLLLAYDTLRGQGSDETLVRISAAVVSIPQATQTEEVRFIQGFYPALRGVLAGEGGQP